MFDPDLEKAVALCKSDEPQPLKKHEQYERLKLFANRQRLATESPEQAFTRFITKTPEGQVLYESFVKPKGASFSPQTGAPGDAKRQSGRSGSDGDDDSGESEGMKTLRSIADKIREKHPELGLSKSPAVALAIQIPAGAAAYLADKKARIRVA